MASGSKPTWPLARSSRQSLPLCTNDVGEALVGPRWRSRSARELLARAREIADKIASRAHSKTSGHRCSGGGEEHIDGQ
jgi:hypothetical protein